MAFDGISTLFQGNIPRVERILALIGRLVMTWNEAELVWFLIYTGLVHQLPRSTAEAIFKRQATGNAQRDLIIAIAENVLHQTEKAEKVEPDPKTALLEYLRTAKKETNNLALERNDLIHGDYHYSIEEPFVTPPHEFGVSVGP